MFCSECDEWEGQRTAPFAKCRYFGGDVPCKSCCPNFHNAEFQKVEFEQDPADLKSAADIKAEEPATVAAAPAPRVIDTNKPKQRRKTATYRYIRHDPDRPDMQLYKHQQQAFDRYKDEQVIPLFFEMGAGKTLTTLKIAEYKYVVGEIVQLLVIAPNDVHKQWYDDLVNGVDVNHDGVRWQELSCDFQVQCVGGRGGQKELEIFEDDGSFKITIVNVDTFSTPRKWEELVFWGNLNNTMIVIDEATVIKNPDSKRSDRLLYEFNDVVRHRKSIIGNKKKDTSLCRAVLTGTPSTNGPVDLWALMEFISPNYFGRNYWSFKNYFGMYTRLSVEYVTPSGNKATREVQVALTEKTWEGIHACSDYNEAFVLFGCSEDTYMTIKHQAKFIGPYKHADELKEQLLKHATFVKTVDCADMPPVNYITRNCGMSTAQEGAYNTMKKDLIAQYGGREMTAKNAMIVTLRLSQISSGFIVGKETLDSMTERMLAGEDVDVDLNPNEVVWLGESCPKLDAVMRDVAELDKPLLILTRFSAEAAKIYELCEKAGYKTGLYTGWKVIGGVDEFKAGNLDILVANSAKVSRGHNLQISHTTLFYSNSYNMETRLQAEFRTFRIGQKHPCTYVDYSAAPVDDMTIDALHIKKGLLEYLNGKSIEEVL